MKVVGNFSSRRDAELAVEHLVQEYGVARDDIDVRPAGLHNTAGSRLAGADAESGHPGVENHGAAKLDGPVEVRVDCADEDADKVRSVLRQTGVNKRS